MWERIRGAMSGAIQGWRNAGPMPIEMSAQQQRYVESWGLYTGELFKSIAKENPYRDDPAIYEHTKLLWKHAEAVVDFYAGVIYQGALPTSTRPLPSGAASAIPVHPEISAATEEEERTRRASYLLSAIYELFAGWNWQQQMSLRPMYGAALADCLTELVADPERRFVYPQIVWPGYVKDIELDYVGNVRHYTLEYHVTEQRDGGTSETYLYRKEVDGEAFRYFKNDRPFDYSGDGSVMPNPYGFVPAIWDRHRIGAPGHVRGRSALHGTRQALLQLNSIFAHAFDFQRKTFFAPIMVAGKSNSRGRERDVEHDVTSSPETFDIVRVSEGAQLLQAEFDVGQTREMLADLRQGIVDENPEARFYQQMREMQQVTAPGAERLMGDVKNRVDLARAGYDSQTIKLFQMAISMCSYHAVRDWQQVGGRRVLLTRRQQVFTMFDLESFQRGELDFVIESRPIVYPTEQERLDLIAAKEALTTEWGMEQAGVPKTEAQAILDGRRERFAIGMSTGNLGGDYR